ncbi:NAD(P)/FAD-dependent oxidoreductase [Pseudomonas sp. Marseille-QA0332]
MINRCGWIEMAGQAPRYPRMSGAHGADWVVIGAGITGLAAAHAIHERFPGHKVVVLERQRAAQGASARNSGFVVAHEFPTLGQRLGQPGYAAYAQAASISIAAAHELRHRVERHRIACELDWSGYYLAARRPERLGDTQLLAQTLESVGAKARVLDRQAAANRLGTDYYQAALHCAGGNGLLQPARYVRGLADALAASVAVYEHTPVVQLRREGRSWVVYTANGEVRSSQVLVCLGAFLRRVGIDDSGAFALELSASLTRPLTQARWRHLAALQPWGVLAPLPGGATLRLLPGRRLLIRNTLEYRLQDIGARALAVRRRRHVQGLLKRFAMLGEDDIEYSWTGHLSATRSGEPFFARLDQGLHAVSGCNGAGVARATLWGRLLVELASSQDSPLLAQVMRQAVPGALPPRPFFDLGAALRLRWETLRAATEN